MLDVSVNCTFNVRFVVGSTDCCDRKIYYEGNIYSFVLLHSPSVTFADSLDQDSTKVEFFERIYKMDIQGVKPYEEYQDPDSFYSEIARKVGIPQVAHDAVGKRFGWKQDDKRFFYATMIKGGGASPDWGVMVTRVPVALQKAQSIEERKAILQLMEMKFVVISYDGNISFPDVETSGRKKTKPIHPNL